MNVLIIEDHPFFAASTARVVLRALPNATVRKTSLLSRGMELIRSEEVRLIISDLTLPDSDPHRTFETISSFAEKSKIIFLSGLTEEYMVVSQIQNEGFRFLSKTAEPPELIRLIGRMFPLVGSFAVPPNEFQSSISFGDNKPLTLQQVAVMELMLQGHSVKTIAADLKRSPDTIKSHVKEAFARLGAHTRAQAVANFIIAKESSESVYDL